MYENALILLNEIEKLNCKAYIVGGYPRDKYLNIYTTDIDICTNMKYEDLKKYFDVKERGYGSYILNYNGYSYDVTTFRKDTEYINHRSPKIEYVETLEEDLKRRDFIINTLCIDKCGEYVDILGAKNDLDNKIIRCVISDDKKIEEDALRIMRAIRLATVLNFELSPSLKEAIVKNKHLLKELSYFRKREELDKIFDSNNKEIGINLLKELKLDIELELDFSLVDYTKDKYGIWKSLDYKKYPFSKEELKKLI